MQPCKLALVLPVVVSALVASPVAAQSYYATPSAAPSSTRKVESNRAAIKRTQARLRQEEEKRRQSARFTDPSAGVSEPLYRGSRLTSGANTTSLPVQSSDNRGVLVPQR